MSGENSKKSGEVGEKIASELLKKIGWCQQIKNISIDCCNDNHKNTNGKQTRSHGDDIVYLYDNPFYDEVTTVAHISVKNRSNGYPNTENAIRKEFGGHIDGLSKIIECAKYNEEINALIDSFDAKVNVKHIGILIWLHNDVSNLNQDILPILAKSRLGLEDDVPYYVIDSSRASFILNVVNDLDKKSKFQGYQFYYPKIGTSILADESRKGDFLPIELIVSDIITAIFSVNDKKYFCLYARESFSEMSYKNMMAYALDITASLIDDIWIGFPDYNPVKDEKIANKVKMSFKDRDESIEPFSYNSTILDLWQESK